MALFVDGPACTIDDLTDQDSGLLDVAGQRHQCYRKLRLAQEEIEDRPRLWLHQNSCAAGSSAVGPSLRIEQIIVTAPLKRWETMHALALVYRDAYFSHMVDRYQAKCRNIPMLANNAREDFIASGLGLASVPVHRVQPPVLSSMTGPQIGDTFYASVAWVNAAGQEGAASDASSITISDGKLMMAAAGNAPANAVGFWLYAGTALHSMFRQMTWLLPAGSTYTYIPGQVTQGPLPGNGQKPDFVRPLARTLMRG